MRSRTVARPCVTDFLLMTQRLTVEISVRMSLGVVHVWCEHNTSLPYISQKIGMSCRRVLKAQNLVMISALVRNSEQFGHQVGHKFGNQIHHFGQQKSRFGQQTLDFAEQRLWSPICLANICIGGGGTESARTHLAISESRPQPDSASAPFR